MYSCIFVQRWNHATNKTILEQNKASSGTFDPMLFYQKTQIDKSHLFLKYLMFDWNINCCELTQLPYRIHIHRGRSDVDCVCVFLAQRFVFFGEKWLAFQAGGADLWSNTDIAEKYYYYNIIYYYSFLIFRFNTCYFWATLSPGPTAHTKQVSCQVDPRASRNLSPASMGKSQPWQLVPNRL